MKNYLYNNTDKIILNLYIIWIELFMFKTLKYF